MEIKRKTYLRVSEAAAMGYGSQGKLYSLIKSGVIPAYQIAPNMLRVKLEDLELLMQPVDPEQVSDDES